MYSRLVPSEELSQQEVGRQSHRKFAGSVNGLGPDMKYLKVRVLKKFGYNKRMTTDKIPDFSTRMFV